MNFIMKELQLPEFTQDWGIIYSDSSRLNEFIKFYLNNNFNSVEKYHLIELIISSANDLLLSSINSEKELKMFGNFYKEHYKDVVVQHEYWIALTGNIEFPIAEICKELSLP